MARFLQKIQCVSSSMSIKKMNRFRLFRYSSEYITQAKATNKSVQLMWSLFIFASRFYVPLCAYLWDERVQKRQREDKRKNVADMKQRLGVELSFFLPLRIFIFIFQVFGFVYNFIKCCILLICKINKNAEQKRGKKNQLRNAYHQGPA